MLEYKEVCVELFGNKKGIEFLKKKLYRHDLVEAKQRLIEEILKHGDTNWKGHELEVFVNVLKNELTKGESTEVEYQVDAK